MNSKSFAISTCVGTVIIMITGTLMFALPFLQTFYTYAMTAGSANGVPRESPLVWAVTLGAFSYALLIVLAIANRPGPVSARRGLVVGAVIGLLLWFTANVMLLAVSHVGSVTSALVNPLVELVPGAVAGAAVAVVLRRRHVVT